MTSPIWVLAMDSPNWVRPIWEERFRRWERLRLEGIQMEQLVVPAAPPPPPPHSDGTTPRRLYSDLSKEEHDAMDAFQRLCELADELEDSAKIGFETSTFLEELMDEVLGYSDEVVGYSAAMIDITISELHHMGRLVDLHRVLYWPCPSTRAKAAEFLTTMVKNNPMGQKLVMEANCLQPLLYNFISDPDATSRTKALGAISALIQNNKPGITAFRLANGYAALKEALDSESVMLLREVLNLILYLLHENSSDNNTLIELGFHRFMIHLIGSDDAKVREATLRGLLVLAKNEEGGNNGQLVKNDDKVKRILRQRIEGIVVVVDPEDPKFTREEIRLLDSLWNACYNEPSLLRQKGLFVLPGEDAHALDVASKLVEPPLRRVWAAVEAPDRNSVSEKKEAPLLLNTRVQNVDELKPVLHKLKLVLHERNQVPRERIEGVKEGVNVGANAMYSDYLHATWVERRMVDSLWNALYDEGVLKLCGMDAHVSYVASKPFEPPLRAWAAAEVADRNLVCEKEEAPLLINVGVKNSTEPTFFSSTVSNQPRSCFPIFRTAPNRSIQGGLSFSSSVLFGFAKCIRFGR